MDESFDNLDQEERIKRLRMEVARLGGSAMSIEDMPADLEEEFLRHVIAYETAEPISLFAMLTNSGLEIPSPDELTAENQTPKLTEIIARMASLGAYILHTDHLSDRDLYEYLYNEGLREEAVLFPENPSYAYMIDLTGSGSEEDNQTYLRYYADDEHRNQWALDWPDDVIPHHEAPPFDRDRFLPKAPI